MIGQILSALIGDVIVIGIAYLLGYRITRKPKK